MSKYLGLLVAALASVACGGSTDVGDASSAGSASGGVGNTGAGGKGSAGAGAVSQGGVGNSSGTSNGGVGNSGAVGNAGAGNSGGTTDGGVSSGGVSNGGVGNSGGISNGGSGGGTVDPRCPAHQPSGACSAADVTCEYSPVDGCLCYNSPGPVTIAFCTKVDPTCMAAAHTTPAPPPEGAGGFSTKVAVPAHQYCTCTNDMWACRYGI